MTAITNRKRQGQYELAPPLADRTGDLLEDSTTKSMDCNNKKVSPETAALQASVDFVILLQTTENKEQSAACFRDLLEAVSDVGLLVQAREGASEGDILVFVHCPLDRLKQAVHSARSRDWLSGVRIAVPDQAEQSIEEPPISDGERLEIIFDLITAPKADQGAAITPNFGKWTSVKSIFPLHDQDFDNAWLKRWSTKWTIDDDELENLCQHFGTKIAMYFAFLQFYLISLASPAAFGLAAFFILPEYSSFYAIGVSVWAMVFTTLWERRQGQLATRWNVRNCSQVEHKRATYHDAVPGEDAVSVKSFTELSGIRKLFRESLVVPFTFLAGAFLVSVLTAIFAVEVFIGEVYDGPFKSVLTFTPTVLFSVIVGPFSAAYMKAAKILTVFEDHETDASFNAAITRKSFVLNFLTSYTALFLTLFVYMPFGHMIVPKLDVFGFTSTYAAYGVTAKPFVLDNDRIRNQLFYFAVTAQVLNLFTVFILPIILRVAKGEAQHLQEKITGHETYKPIDSPSEAQFLARVRYESCLPEYDAYTDYAELVVQFGYTVMFSPIWTLTPLCAALNNVVELRADAAKLCKNMRRPVPIRADSIGPWADNLVFLTWLGSMTTASITYLLGGDAASSKPFLYMLAVSLFAEHGYLLARKCVSVVISRVPNRTHLAVIKEELSVREQYLEKLTRVTTPTKDESEETLSFFKSNLNEVQNLGSQIILSKTKAQDKSQAQTVLKNKEL